MQYQTIFRNAHRSDFTTLSNKTIRDPEVSLKAHGLHAHLLSLPPDWKVNISYLCKATKTGKASIGSAIAELQAAGYVHKFQARRPQGQNGAGQFTPYEYLVFESPKTSDEVAEMTEKPAISPQTDFPVAGNPVPDKPVAENPPLQKKDLTNKRSNKRNTTQKARFSSRNDAGCGGDSQATQEGFVDDLETSVLETKQVIDAYNKNRPASFGIANYTPGRKFLLHEARKATEFAINMPEALAIACAQVSLNPEFHLTQDYKKETMSAKNRKIDHFLRLDKHGTPYFLGLYETGLASGITLEKLNTASGDTEKLKSLLTPDRSIGTRTRKIFTADDAPKVEELSPEEKREILAKIRAGK